MQDRYLFRGKTKCIVGTYNFGKEDGEWVEGSLRCDCGKYTIFQFETDRADYIAYEVDPSTICQCTGLKDKNGKLIWENDVCKRSLLPTKRIGAHFRVVYDKPKCCLAAIDLNGWNKTFLNDYINSGYEVEVVGNIIDNKELLEE